MIQTVSGVTPDPVRPTTMSRKRTRSLAAGDAAVVDVGVEQFAGHVVTAVAGGVELDVDGGRTIVAPESAVRRFGDGVVQDGDVVVVRRSDGFAHGVVLTVARSCRDITVELVDGTVVVAALEDACVLDVAERCYEGVPPGLLRSFTSSSLSLDAQVGLVKRAHAAAAVHGLAVIGGGDEPNAVLETAVMDLVEDSVAVPIEDVRDVVQRASPHGHVVTSYALHGVAALVALHVHAVLVVCIAAPVSGDVSVYVVARRKATAAVELLVARQRNVCPPDVVSVALDIIQTASVTVQRKALEAVAAPGDARDLLQAAADGLVSVADVRAALGGRVLNTGRPSIRSTQCEHCMPGVGTGTVRWTQPVVWESCRRTRI
jgi:hypothetical protein